MTFPKSRPREVVCLIRGQIAASLSTEMDRIMCKNKHGGNDPFSRRVYTDRRSVKEMSENGIIRLKLTGIWEVIVRMLRIRSG